MTAFAAGAQPTPAGATAGLYVYCADLGGAWAQSATSFLADEDLARLATLSRERRKTDYLGTRALLRFALQSYTGREARSHRLRVTPAGKPECVDGPAVSVCHSEQSAACAVAPSGALGVDLEFPSRRRRTADIARHYFTPGENEWLKDQPSEAFYALWVLKEAYAKALGVGVFGGLNLLECRVEAGTIEWRTARAGHAPMLALYRFGSGFLGLAAIGAGVCPARAAFVGAPGAGALPAIRLVASSR